MKKKNKKGIKEKPWQIFSYYMMPFILGIVAFFGFSRIILSGSDNKLYTLLDLVNKFNQNTLLSIIIISFYCYRLFYLLDSIFRRRRK